MKPRAYLEKTLILQQGESDCGVACLASILAYHGGYAPLERLRELSGTTSQGTTLLGLHQAACQLGFDPEGFQADSVENLKTDTNGPVILHVLIDNRLQHYVVCYGWDSHLQQFVIGDPARGLVLYSAEALTTLWPSRVLLALQPNTTFQRRSDERREKNRWLLNLIRADIPLLAIATGLGIITAGLGLSTAIFSQKLIDEILPQQDSQRLRLGLALLTLLLIARAMVGYLRGFLLNRQSRDFNNRLIHQFYSSLLYLPKSFFDSRKTGELIARLNDAGRIQRSISYLTGTVVINTLVVLVCVGFLFTYSPWIGFLSLLSVPIYAGLAWRYHQAILSGQHDVMAASAHAESNYVDTLQGIEVIKATNRQSLFGHTTQAIYGHFQAQLFRLANVALRFNVTTEVFSAVLIAAFMTVTSVLVVQQALKLGEMMAILTLTSTLLPSVASLALTNLQLQEARVAFDRLFEYVQLKPEFQADPEAGLKSFSLDSLRLENVSFRFPGRPLLLKNLSLTIQKGECIALLGEIGSGKSTLLQVLQRFYAPETGTIYVNETNWQTIDTPSWRSTVGVVPQQVKLFNGTLLDNIGLGNTAEEAFLIIEFCRNYGFDAYFSLFPQGYLTRLGEDGVNLSGGQLQLIGLARALYRKPQMLLLDEPTAAMDPQTETFVMDLLQRLRPSLGILLITHKLQTAERADRVYHLKKGTLTPLPMSIV